MCCARDYSSSSSSDADVARDLEQLCKGVLGKRNSPEGKTSPRKLRKTDDPTAPLPLVHTRLQQHALVIMGQPTMRILDVVLTKVPKDTYLEAHVAYDPHRFCYDRLDSHNTSRHHAVSYITNVGRSDVRNLTGMDRFMRFYSTPSPVNRRLSDLKTWEAEHQPELIYVGHMPDVKTSMVSRCPLHSCGPGCPHDLLLHIVGMPIDYLNAYENLLGGIQDVYQHSMDHLRDEQIALERDCMFPVCSRSHLESYLDIAIYPQHRDMTPSMTQLLGSYLHDYFFAMIRTHSMANTRCPENEYSTPATAFASLLLWFKMIRDSTVSYTALYLRVLLVAAFHLSRSSISGAIIHPHRLPGTHGMVRQRSSATAANTVRYTLDRMCPHGDHGLSVASGRQVCHYILNRFQWCVIPLVNPVDLLLQDRTEMSVWISYLLKAKRFRQPGQFTRRFPGDKPGWSQCALYVAYSLVTSVPAASGFDVPLPVGYAWRTDKHYYFGSYTVEHFLFRALGWLPLHNNRCANYTKIFEECRDLTEGTPLEVKEKMARRVRRYLLDVYLPNVN